MRESRPKAARGAVNWDVGAASNSASISSQQTNSTLRAPGRGEYEPGDADETLNSQEFERQRRQLLEEDSQIDEEFANSQLARRITINLTNEPKKDTPYSQLKAPRAPLVSETQLQGLFDDTQFDKGFKKPARPEERKRTQNVHGHPSQSQSQDTQHFDDLKNKFADEESQIESQVEPIVAKAQKQGWTFANVDKEVTPERESVKEVELRKETVPSQADESQFVAGLRAQFLDSQVDSQQGDTSQLEEVSAQEKKILTGTFEEPRGAETQGSNQVVLFPPGTSFGGGQGEIQLFSQSQSQSQNGDSGRVSNLIDTSESQERASQVPTILAHVDNHVRQPGSDHKLQSAKSSSTSHLQNQSHQTTANASAQPKITERLSLTSKQTRKTSLEKLKGRAMDDWQRDSLGTASQTQENSGPRYGLTTKAQSRHGDSSTKKSSTKKSRSSVTQSGSSGRNVDVDRTYNENESGAVRLGLTQSQTQISQTQNFAVSQDQGMRSPSYDFARQSRAVDDTSQLEPETPATTKKNPFRKSGTGTGAPMGMSQVFAATQSSPLDPRFVQESDGLRPSSPGIGLPSSPIARRPALSEKDSQEVEASSPSYINLAVASSFHPFDEGTQPEAIRKANPPRAKSPTPIRKEIRHEVAEKYKDRIDAAEIRESQEERRRAREAAEEARIAEARRKAIFEDDGMDIEKENRARIAKKRQEEATERNLREVGDMMGPRKEEKPVLDRVRRAASTDKVIVKNPIRENRFKRKSEGRNSPPKDQAPKAQAARVEEVEVPASGEAAKQKEKTPPKKKSRHKRTHSEEYRAQSQGTDGRDTQGTESQVIRSSQAPRSSAPHSSQQEFVIDSQNNISTQAIPDHNSLSLEEVQGSYHPPSSRRPKSKPNRTSSAILPALGKEDSGLFVSQNSQPTGSVSVPVTSSGHNLKAGQTTPGGTKSSNDAAAEVVPETSPASKTPSPEKLPFGDLDMVDDTPMPSFSDMRMTQEAPHLSDATPSKFVKRTYGKKSPVKKRPEQIGPGRGVKINFSEVSSDEEVKGEKTKRKKNLHPGYKLAKTKESPKSARFVIEDDEEEGEQQPSPVPKKATRGQGKQVEGPKNMMPVARMCATPVEDDEEPEASPSPVPKRSSRAKGKQAEKPKPVPAPKAPKPTVGDGDNEVNANALASLQELERPKRSYKKSIPYKPVEKLLAPSAEASPQSAPIRPAVPPGRSSARRQPSDLKNVAAPVTAQATSGDVEIQYDSDDDAPIARPTLSKRRIDNTVPNTGDTEMANTSPVKSNKLAGTPPFLPPLDDSGEDESVSPIRQSIEKAAKAKLCPYYSLGRPCKKDHSKDGLTHDSTFQALSAKRRGASNVESDIPSTASPGKSATTEDRSILGSSASAFTRPEPTGEAHLPPTATGGRTRKEPGRQQPEPQAQTNSEYATAQSSLPARRFSIESSPLSDLNSELAEELEEFHTAKETDEIAKAGPSRQSTRESTAIFDAALMPPPQTVSRQLDFAAPAAVDDTPMPPPNTSGRSNKRSASTSGSKGKKAAKTTPDDTPSRSRCATRSASLAATSSDNEDDEDGGDNIVVRDTPRVTPTPRAGRQASRPIYAESPSTDGENTAVASPKTATRSRTPSPFTAVSNSLELDKVNHLLFKGMAFAVSYKDSTREGVKDREEIEALIVEHGGQLIDDFKNLFEKIETSMVATHAIFRNNSSANLASANTSMAGLSRKASLPPRQSPAAEGAEHVNASCDLVLTKKAKKLGFVALIGDAPTRKSKFLQSLALSLPCLDSRWIRCCIEKNCIMAWKLFLLSSGFAHKLHEMDCTRDLAPYPAKMARFEETFEGRRKMLEGMGVLFLIVKSSKKKAEKEVLEAKKEHYLWLTRALGAREIRRVKDVKEANELLWDGGRGEGNGWDVVYVDDGEKLATYRAQILDARWYEDGQESEAEAEDEEDNGDEEEDDLPIVPAKGKSKAPAAKSKSKAVAPAEDVEMQNAEQEEDGYTQPAEPKEKKKREEKMIRVVSDEFVVQSLILGVLEDEDLVDEE